VLAIGKLHYFRFNVNNLKNFKKFSLTAMYQQLSTSRKAAAADNRSAASVIITNTVDVIKDGASGDVINILINDDIRISDYGATGRADQRPGHVRRASNVQGQQFCRSKVV